MGGRWGGEEDGGKSERGGKRYSGESGGGVILERLLWARLPRPRSSDRQRAPNPPSAAISRRLPGLLSTSGNLSRLRSTRTFHKTSSSWARSPPSMACDSRCPPHAPKPE